MSEIPTDLHYTPEHEWVRRTGADTVRVGITDYAQSALGDVVYVDLPEVGDEVTAGGEFGNVESTKSQSDLYAPLGGTVAAVNGDVVDSPELVNSDPYGGGWLIELRLESAAADEGIAGLLDAAAYGDSLDE